MADIISTPKDGDGDIYDAAIDTDVWLASKLGQDIAGQLPQNVEGWPQDAETQRGIEEITGEPMTRVTYDNVYNSENDFKSVFVYAVYIPDQDEKGQDEWYNADNVYVAVVVHIGGDVRGNYGRLRLYKSGDLAGTGFTDWVLGWYVTDKSGEQVLDSDRFSVGYANNPTSELAKYLDSDKGKWKKGVFYGTMKGKPVKCYPEAR